MALLPSEYFLILKETSTLECNGIISLDSPTENQLLINKWGQFLLLSAYT